MTQVNVNVSQHSFANSVANHRHRAARAKTGYASDLDVAAVEDLAGAVVSGRAVGLVDYFA